MAASFNSYGLEPWIVKQILSFLNKARDPADIHIEDTTNPGSGYAIGKTVATRILEWREQLPGRRFTQLEQLRHISGLGQDKLHDLVGNFSLPAAEAFQRDMTQRVLPANFSLHYDSIHIREPRNFHLIAQTPSRLLHLIAKRLEAITYETYGETRASRLLAPLLGHCYVDTYESGHTGAYAFALWFYRFDQDNWFGFEQVRQATAAYLERYEAQADRLELRLFKGFPNAGLLIDPITVPDLPVVVNYAEQVITIWRGQLRD